MSKYGKYCEYCGQPGERYYSPETLAIILDCPVETIRSWIKDRKIGSVKFGRLRRIPARELEKMAQRFPCLEEIAEGASF